MAAEYTATISENSELIKAYVQAKADVRDAEKNAKNPHLGNTYADLSSVLEAIRPIEKKHGLSLMQIPGVCQTSADGMGAILTLHGILMHGPSGQLMQFATQVPFAAELNKKTQQTKLTAQGLGSAITYARRYQLASVYGITQVDDDGNAGSGRNDEPAAADNSEELLSQIALAVEKKDLELLKPLRDAVSDLNSTKVTNAYLAARKSIKGE